MYQNNNISFLKLHIVDVLLYSPYFGNEMVIAKGEGILTGKYTRLYKIISTNKYRALGYSQTQRFGSGIFRNDLTNIDLNKSQSHCYRC